VIYSIEVTEILSESFIFSLLMSRNIMERKQDFEDYFPFLRSNPWGDFPFCFLDDGSLPLFFGVSRTLLAGAASLFLSLTGFSAMLAESCLCLDGEASRRGGLYLAEPLLDVVLQLATLSSDSLPMLVLACGAILLTRGSRDSLRKSFYASFGNRASALDLDAVSETTGSFSYLRR
jgi:hypothetical protein